MSHAELVETVGDATSVAGFFVGFVTLYTGVLASARSAEDSRAEPVAATLAALRRQLPILLGITAFGLVGLAPLVVEVLQTVDPGAAIEPVLWLFLSTVPLLLALVIWQVDLLGRSRSNASKRNAASRWWLWGAVVDAVALVVLIVMAFAT